jgi:hypothetical protein
MTTRSPARFPLMALAMVALLAGMWGGLLRMGWVLPLAHPVLVFDHGPLMVSGFLGTLIGLERAVALGQRWAYAGPVLTGLGVIALLAGLPAPCGQLLLAAGSLVLMAVLALIIGAQPELFAVTMGLGAACWFVGNSLWALGRPVFGVVSWWLGFLVLTIAGERLELSRMLERSRPSQVAFVGIIALFAAGLTRGGFGSNTGARLGGLALLALAVWLLRYDVARRTVRQRGLSRFTAVCLVSGYIWLVVAGVLTLWFGGVIAGFAYDAVLHTVLLGFVFAMIFGHAPIIFPAVLGLPVPFRSAFYAHLAALHVSVLLRVYGDLTQRLPLRQWGGLLNVVAVMFFLANTVKSVVLQASRSARADSPTLAKT